MSNKTGKTNNNHPPLPLSFGLLVSMALRFDHSFLLDKNPEDKCFLASIGYDDVERFLLIRSMYHIYKQYESNGTTDNIQLDEEISGRGFFSGKSSEEMYVRSVSEDVRKQFEEWMRESTKK